MSKNSVYNPDKPHSQVGRKQSRKADADKRQAKAAKRDPELQLRRLDRRVGKKGAQKERARLNALLEQPSA